MIASFPSYAGAVATLIRNILDTLLPTRQIVVNNIDDFPEAIGGVITLLPNVQYLIGDNMSIGSNRLVLGAFTVIKGIDVDNSRIESTTTGALITATNISWLIEDITLSAENGAIFSHTDTGSGFVQIRNVQIGEADTIGTFTSNGGVWFVSRFIATGFSDGVSFFGSWNIMQLEIASDVQIQGTFLDFGSATFNSIGIQGASIFLVTAGAKFLSGLTNSGNINAGGLGRVTNCVVNNFGGGTLLTNISPDDDRWRFFNNQNIRDTRPDALMSFTGNVALTDIVTQSVPVKINANTSWLEDHSAQFTLTTDGKMTFTGEVDQRLPINILANVQMASGTPSDVELCIAINGSVVMASCATVNDVTNSKPKFVTTFWQHMFEPGDYIEFYVANLSGTTDILVKSAIARIN